MTTEGNVYDEDYRKERKKHDLGTEDFRFIHLSAISTPWVERLEF